MLTNCARLQQAYIAIETEMHAPDTYSSQIANTTIHMHLMFKY